MKYEMIFGDEALFDGAPEDAEYAGWFCQEVRWYMILNGKILFSDGGTWCTSDNPYLSADIAAMRRIIRTPTWTKEDQKAGKLPPVGCRVLYARNGFNGEIVSIDDSDDDDVELCLRFKDKSLLVCKMNLVKPIESPEEKSARLREEWCSNALGSASILSGMREYELKRLGGYIENIYDALLSGDLPVPGKGE